LTHPDYAALVDPLFAFGVKRVVAEFKTLFPACGREGGRAKQRPGESTKILLLNKNSDEFKNPSLLIMQVYYLITYLLLQLPAQPDVTHVKWLQIR
jgi:hypothetical protein